MSTATNTHPRITLGPEKLGGKPCIRGLRISVQDVLGYLASGMTEQQILDEFPDLEKEDSKPFIDSRQKSPATASSGEDPNRRNLPPRLSERLADLFPEMHHVRELALKGKQDPELWHFARTHGYAAILTTDIDFQNRVLELGAPPRVVRIDRCDFSAHEITLLLRREAVRSGVPGIQPPIAGTPPPLRRSARREFDTVLGLSCPISL